MSQNLEATVTATPERRSSEPLYRRGSGGAKALPVRSSRHPRLTTAERRCSIAKVRPDIGQKQ